MSTKVTDPNAKGSAGFIWAVVVLLVIIAAVIGYIIWNGQGAKTEAVANKEVQKVSITMQNEDGKIVLSSDKATADTPSVELFEDYSCPHCAELAEATDAEMKTAIENGELTVTIRQLNFLDGNDLENQEGHSTKAAAAMEALSRTGDVQTYWNLRSYLFTHQNEVYNKWDLKDFADAAKGFGADDSTVKAIEDADIKQLGNSIAAANAKELKDETGELSSPRIIHDGKDLIGENDSINDWVNKAKAL